MKEDKKVTILPVHHAGKISSEGDLVEQIGEMIDLKLAKGFQEQNANLQRGISRLIEELDDVRSGKKDQAFGKLTSADEGLPLPNIKADMALMYSFTSTAVGAKLGLHASQVGKLLGPNGLNWAGNSDYQEMSRYQKGQPRFWHRSVPKKLQEELHDLPPKSLGKIVDIQVIAIVRKYRKENGLSDVLKFPRNRRSKS